MADRIQIRRDLAANWTATNPILAQGEMGYEIDAEPFPLKVGDGITPWNSLPYFTGVVSPSSVVISAGTQAFTGSNFTFSNSHGLSFGMDNGTVTASYNSTQFLGTGATASFRFTSQNSQLQFTSANSNFRFTSADSQLRFTSADSQLRFTSADSQLQFTSQMSDYQLVANSSLSLGTGATASFRFTSQNSQLVFSSAGLNLTNISATLGSNSISLSVAAQSAQTGISALIASDATYTSGTVSFKDGNGISFASTTGQIISLTHGLAYTSNDSLSLGTGATASFRFTSADSQLQFTSATSAITSNALNTSVSRVINIVANTNSTAGGTASLSSDVSFSAANGITFYTSAGNAIVANFGSANYLQTGATASFQFTSNTSAITSNALNTSVSRVINIIAATNNTGGGTASLSSNVSFSNVNGATFYTSAGGAIALSYSVPTQSNQTVGLYGLGNTTQNSSTTLDARSISLNGLGAVTVGYSNGSVQISVPAVVAQTNQTVGLYGLGNTTQNSSTTLDARTLSFNGLGIITVGYSNGSIQLSATQSNQNVSLFALNQTTQNSSTVLNASNLSFAGRGIVTVGYSNGSIQISATEVAQTNQNISLFALGNTTQNSSTLLNASNLSFNAIGSLTVGYSNGSIQLSAANALTTAMLSNAATISNINISGGTTSSNLSNFKLIDSNGVSWSLDTGSKIYATVKTDYLTTAMVSDAGSRFVNTSAGLNLTNISATFNSNSISLSVAAGGSINISGGTTSSNLTNFKLIDSNGVSWSLDTGSKIYATVKTDYLTTAALSSQTLAFSLSGNTATTNSSQILNGGYALAGGNGVTLQQSNNTISISVATNYQSQAAYLTTAAQSTQTNVFSLSGNTATTNSSVISAGAYAFAGGNGVTLQMSNNTVSWSVATNYQSQAAYLTTADLSQNSSNYIRNWKLTGNTAGTTSSAQGTDLWLAGGNGLTISGSSNSLSFSVATSYLASNASTNYVQANAGFNGTNASGTIASNSWSVSVAAQTNQTVGLYALGNTTQNSSTTLDARTLSFNGLGIITAGYSNGSIQISATQSNQAFTAAGGSSAFQTLAFGDTNSVSWTNTNGSVGIASIKLQMFAVSNTTQNTSGTANHTALSFGGAGIASVGVTGGSIVISVPSGGGAGDGGNTLAAGTRTAGSNSVVLFSNSNNFTWGLDAVNGSVMTASYSESNQTIGLYALGNTTQNSSTTLDARTLSFNGLGAATWGYSNGSIQVSVPATSSLSATGQVSISVNGSTISIGVANPYISSYENLPGIYGSSAATFNGASVSHAALFNMPENMSASFLRIPVLMTLQSTTIATMASATATASGALYSTWNAVLYTLGTGASSKSLISAASGSNGWTFSQQISVTNSTQASYSLGYSANVEGGGTTRTTQYSISNTNYSFTTNQFTEFSSNRMLDINFVNVITAGPYWLVIGYSSSSASGGAAGLAALTNCFIKYSNHYGASQAALSFGVMGSTNMTSGGLMGAASFSTAGGGTTSAFNISALSSMGSLFRPYFQLLRSA